MPNEGPPKIEIQQQIENNYHGPVYMLDAETTKKLILDNPNIIALTFEYQSGEVSSLIGIKNFL